MSFSSSAGHSRQARNALARWTRALLSLCMVGLPFEGVLALGFVATGQEPGKEVVGPLRERPREQRSLGAQGNSTARQVRATQLQARLAWLELLFSGWDGPGLTAMPAATRRVVAPRASFEVYKHGRVIDPSIYLHHASR